MPWTAADAGKHKKGLSEKQARQWAEVANSVLRECQEMKQSNCEAKAIKSANSAIGGKND